MLTGYLRQRRRTLLAFFLFGGIFAAAFALYQLPLRAVAYPFVLCAAAGAVLLTLDYRRVLRQHRRLELLRQLPEELADALPPADTVTEADYRSLVTLLAESRRAIRTQEEQRYGDMVDYYTMWAHQIKTPIASMRLTLQNEDSDLARSLSGDLMRVEQYVEMVLVFLRLDSSTTDYVIRSHSLDDIVRPAVRKFAGEFIRRHLRLDYQPLDRTVVTDAKWLGFVVEQVLSNALKYTAQGSVTIAMDGSGTPAWASHRRTCPGSSTGGSRASTAAGTPGPAASGCTCAAGSAAAWVTPSGPPPCPTRERKSASVWARRKRCRSKNRPKLQTKHDTPSRALT